MLVHREFIPGLAVSSHVVGDERSGEAAVIDPTRDPQPYLDFAKEEGLHIRAIIETHVHADFVSGARELAARLDGKAEIWCSALGGEEWTPPYADHQVGDGDTLELGQLLFRFQHLPGHTPEHVGVLLYDRSRSAEDPWLVFTGDFLFVGDVGRPDLLGEEAQRDLAHQLYASVFERTREWPDFTEILPSHGAGSLCGKAIGSRPSSTIGYERRYNPSLEHKPEEQWIRDLLDDMPPYPPYFKRMKWVNREGPTILGPAPRGLERRSPRQVRDGDDGLILDIRSKEAFAAAHIPGAINIPLSPQLATWAGWTIPYERPITIVAERPELSPEAAAQLVRVGFDDVTGCLEGGIGAWETAGFPLASLRTASVQDLDRRLREDEPLTVVDVRTESEWNSGHISGALHIHGGLLQDRVEEIPRDRPVAVICGSGYRGSIASSFLAREGFEEVANVLGGMSAWKAAGLPSTKEE